MNNTILDDKILIHKLKSNNPDLINEGFEGIFNKYSKLIFVCINNIVKDRISVEDLVSDTFLRLYENREKLKADKNFKYYLVTIAKNISLNELSKKQIEYSNVDDMYLEDVVDDKKDISEIINRLNEVLDIDEVKIVINHLIYGFTFEEIAYKTSQSTNTIKTKYYRAIKKVK